MRKFLWLIAITGGIWLVVAIHKSYNESYLRRINFPVPARTVYESKLGRFEDTVYVHAFISQSDMKLFLSGRDQSSKHLTIYCNGKKDYQELIKRNEEFFPRYAPLLQAGKLKTVNSRGVKFSSYYVYYLDPSNNEYSVYIRALPY